MSATTQPEAWLRGPVDGVIAALQPVAHALLQAREDAERLVRPLALGELWQTPGEAASVGWHLRHCAGSLDRLLTYARGEGLSSAQRASLLAESQPAQELDSDELLGVLYRTIDHAFVQLRATPEADLDAERRVGRAGHPSTVRGLLHHAAEHTTRHLGQISTTVKVLRGARR